MTRPSRTLLALALIALAGCDDSRTGGPDGVKVPEQETRAIPRNAGNPSSPDVGTAKHDPAPK